MSTKLYGASDDLIELDGDLSEEINPTDDDWTPLTFSDGTMTGNSNTSLIFWPSSARVIC